jgi:hypothetical protein
MTSSNGLLAEFAHTPGIDRDPGFAVILAFDYYDGPERGFALYPSGKAVRFSTLGDSESRLLRAFELIPIEGNWWSKVEPVQQAEGVDPSRRILVPSQGSEALNALEKEVVEATGLGQFVGVGSPDFERISICPVTSADLGNLRKLRCSPAGFEFANRLVKGWSAES